MLFFGKHFLVCPNNALTDLKRETNLELNGWIINATFPSWQYVHQCGKETWFGWNGGNSVGAISAILKGSSKATLTFGNCWTRGYVRAYLNEKLIGSAGGLHLGRGAG